MEEANPELVREIDAAGKRGARSFIGRLAVKSALFGGALCAVVAPGVLIGGEYALGGKDVPIMQEIEVLAPIGFLIGLSAGSLTRSAAQHRYNEFQAPSDEPFEGD